MLAPRVVLHAIFVEFRANLVSEFAVVDDRLFEDVGEDSTEEDIVAKLT